MRDNIIAYVWCINVMGVGVYFEGIEHTMTKYPIRYWLLVAYGLCCLGAYLLLYNGGLRVIIFGSLCCDLLILIFQNILVVLWLYCVLYYSVLTSYLLLLCGWLGLTVGVTNFIFLAIIMLKIGSDNL